MPIWMVLTVQLRSATLLEELKALVGTLLAPWRKAFRATSAARLWANARFWAQPRLYDARSQFSQQGFNGRYGLAFAPIPIDGRNLAIQERGGQGRFSRFDPRTTCLTRCAPPSGSRVCSGLYCRT